VVRRKHKAQVPADRSSAVVGAHGGQEGAPLIEGRPLIHGMTRPFPQRRFARRDDNFV